MYELLTGTAAFAPLAEESLAAILVQGPTAPVPELGPQGVPDPLAMIVHAAMDKDPSNRPSASRLARALELCDARSVPSVGVVQQTLGIVLGPGPEPQQQDSLNIVLRSPSPPAPSARDTIVSGRPSAPPPGAYPSGAGPATPTPAPGLPFVPTMPPKRRRASIVLVIAVVISVLVAVFLVLG
jgi:hypothetical protein